MVIFKMFFFGKFYRESFDGIYILITGGIENEIISKWLFGIVNYIRRNLIDQLRGTFEDN